MHVMQGMSVLQCTHFYLHAACMPGVYGRQCVHLDAELEAEAVATAVASWVWMS